MKIPLIALPVISRTLPLGALVLTVAIVGWIPSTQGAVEFGPIEMKSTGHFDPLISGCQFLDDAGSNRKATADQTLLAPSTDDNWIRKMGQRISQGLAESSILARRLGARENWVDIPVLVRESVEQSLVECDPEQDPYWNYYSSCDRWNVCFADSAANLPIREWEWLKSELAASFLYCSGYVRNLIEVEKLPVEAHPAGFRREIVQPEECPQSDLIIDGAVIQILRTSGLACCYFQQSECLRSLEQQVQSETGEFLNRINYFLLH